MPVRKTESKIPVGFTAADLGLNAVSPTSADVILVSYLSSPTAAQRIQNYVVFVTNAGLAATVQSYDWVFNNGAATNLNTTVGIAEFTPQNTGTLTVSVTLKNATNNALHTVTLSQQVNALNNALELLIDQTESSFPLAGSPETSRELINDLRPYVSAIIPTATDELFNKAVCSLVYARSLQTPQIRRNVLLEDLANILNTQPANFYAQAKDGFGVAKTRPHFLAMAYPNPATPGSNFLNGTTFELPSPSTSTQRTDNAAAIETAFNALGVDVHVDIFNLLRFPKSHIARIKRLMEGIATTYYSTASIGATLGNTDNAKILITEYEQGFIALGSGSTRLRASSFSTSVFNLFNHAVWAVPITALSGTPAAGPAGASIPATIGIPEKLPTHTFIAHHETEAGFSGGSLGFLREAFLYHDSYALNPQEVRSIQELVTILSGSNDPIGRLRIATHFGAPSGATTLQNVGTMFLPFFTGQTLNSTNTPNFQCKAEHFKYGTSDLEGVRAQFRLSILDNLNPDFLSGLTMNTTGDANQREFHDAIFRFLQRNTHIALEPFGLRNSGTPSDSVRVIMKWAAGLFFLNNGTLRLKANHPVAVAAAAMDPLLITDFRNTIQSKITALYTTSGATIQSNVDALVLAFSSLTYASVGATTFHNSMDYSLCSHYLQNHNTLRTELAIVRNRLNNAFVDIRGCRIGQDRNFLQALRTFFGNPGSEPTISGPEWYQQFGTMGSISVSGSLAGIETLMDQMFDSGISNTHISSTDVQREYSAWAGRIGINSQISFWTNLFNGHAYDIISLQFRNTLPPIGMESARLQAMITQSYTDVIATLKSLFHQDQTVPPLAADNSTFETNIFPSIATLNGIITAVTPLTDSSPQADLTNQRTALQTLATAVGATLAAAPAPITRAHLDACVTVIKDRLVTLSGITPLVAIFKTRLAHPKAGYRYLFDTGLPLMVQSASHENDSRILFYADHMANALKSFKKIQFEAPFPAATLTAIDTLAPTGSMVKDNHGTGDPNDDTYNDVGKGLLFSGLAIDHANTQVANIPSEEFNEHIKTEP